MQISLCHLLCLTLGQCLNLPMLWINPHRAAVRINELTQAEVVQDRARREAWSELTILMVRATPGSD